MYSNLGAFAGIKLGKPELHRGKTDAKKYKRSLYPGWEIQEKGGKKRESQGRLNAPRKLFTFIERPGQENCRQDQKDHVPR